MKDGCNGYIVKADAAEEYADRIRKIYYGSEMAKKMGECGWHMAQAYTAESVKKELEQIYKLL